MKLRFPHLALVGLVFAPACDSSSSEPGVATVTGRYSSGAGLIAQAEVMRVDDDGMTQVVASASLAADGTFRVETPAGDGPFVVQIVTGSEVVGQVILPHDLSGGEDVTTLTIDAESATEVAAYLAILAGDEDRADVDAIGLMTWVNAQLALEADAANIGAAWMQAQDGYLATVAEAGVTLSAEALAEIKADAFKVFAATAGELEDQIEFHQEIAADLATHLSLDAQVDAQLAAATLGAAALTGRAAELAADQGAILTAHVTWASQHEVAATVQTRLELAYRGFFEALDRGEAMAAAQLELAAALGGDGQVAVGSVLSAAATADGVGATELRAAIASADIGLRGAIDAALSGGTAGRVNAIASAITDARANARAHFEAALGNTLTARLASELFVVASHTEHLLTLDLITQISAGIRLDGVIDGQLGASLAALWTLSGDLIAQGSVNGGTWSFDGIATVDLDGPVVVVLADTDGEWRGALVIAPRTPSGDVTITTPISAETTAHARVALELVALGEGDDAAVAMLSLLSDIEARLVTDTESATTLAAAVAARAHLNTALGSIDAALTDGVTATFVQAAVDAAEGSDDATWRFRLLSRIDAATAIETTAQNTLSSNRFTELRAALALAVDTFLDAANDASTSTEAEAAWQGFTTAMTTITTTGLSAALGLQGQLIVQLQSMLSAANEARVRFETAVSGAFAGALDQQSLETAAETTARAAATFNGELALDLSFVVDLVAHDQSAAARFVATVNAWGAAQP